MTNMIPPLETVSPILSNKSLTSLIVKLCYKADLVLTRRKYIETFNLLLSPRRIVSESPERMQNIHFLSQLTDVDRSMIILQDIRIVTQQVLVQNFTTWPCLWR